MLLVIWISNTVAAVKYRGSCDVFGCAGVLSGASMITWMQRCSGKAFTSGSTKGKKLLKCIVHRCSAILMQNLSHLCSDLILVF